MISVSYPILGGNLAEVGAASRLLKEQLKRLGVQTDVMRRVMIAAYEAEANVTIHAKRGTLFARLGDGRIDMEIVDEGPGIPDVGLAMSEGWSTASEEARKLGFGAGMGLPNIRRSSDRFSLETEVGRGTRVRSTIVFRAEAASPAATPAASPRILPERCVACLACVRACPTEAIRLRDGRPAVLAHLCVGCASCVASCRYGAFSVVEPSEPASLPAGSILVAPAGLLGGLGRDPAEVLLALGRLGVRELRLLEEWEEALLEEARRAASSGSAGPVIAPICPAVVNLVLTSYPVLIPQLLPCLSPVEAAARELGTEPMVVVVGCPAQAALLEGDGSTGRAQARTPADIASLVSGAARAAEAAALRARGFPPAGGPGSREGVVRIEGVRRVTATLAAAERGLLADVAVLDLRLCEGGCAGSPLHAVDPAVSGARVGRIGPDGRAGEARRPRPVPREEPYARRRGVRLDDDMARAMEKLRKIDEVGRTLPGRNCAVCGSPSCASLAEDIVLGRTAARCPFVAAGGPQ